MTVLNSVILLWKQCFVRELVFESHNFAVGRPNPILKFVTVRVVETYQATKILLDVNGNTSMRILQVSIYFVAFLRPSGSIAMKLQSSLARLINDVLQHARRLGQSPSFQ